MSAPHDYKHSVAFFILKAIEEGETEQSGITDYVRHRLPWMKKEDVAEAAHFIIDTWAQMDVEQGSTTREVDHAA